MRYILGRFVVYDSSTCLLVCFSLRQGLTVHSPFDCNSPCRVRAPLTLILECWEDLCYTTVSSLHLKFLKMILYKLAFTS